MANAFDLATNPVGHAHDIASLGWPTAVGLYLRGDRCSLDAVQGLHSVGLNVFSIWEKGEPVSVEYFCAVRGQQDAIEACQFAAAIGMPTGLTKPIFACVDYDASPSDICGPVLEYMSAFHATCKGYGYLAGVYGSGATCQAMIDFGVAHYGYLDQSVGHSGHAEFLPRASIVQEPSSTVLGWDVDLDTVTDLAVVW